VVVADGQLVFVEDSEEQWLKMPALRDGDVELVRRIPYDVHTSFHELFVLFGYLAALTSLELVTSM
jgi:hypothetical protein